MAVQSPKVGDTVYEFDGNRRVYEPDASGHSRIVFAKHFMPHVVVGEEGRSVLVKPVGDRWKMAPEKVGRAAFGKGKWFTEEQHADLLWEYKHRHAVIRMLERGDVSTLRRVAEMIGYTSDSEG
jgi:hypothetical protein